MAALVTGQAPPNSSTATPSIWKAEVMRRRRVSGSAASPED
jgi:hypothetical protein